MSNRLNKMKKLVVLGLILGMFVLPNGRVQASTQSDTCEEMPAVRNGTYYNRTGGSWTYRKIHNWSFVQTEWGKGLRVNLNLTYTFNGEVRSSNKTHIDGVNDGIFMGYWYDPKRLPDAVIHRYHHYRNYSMQNISYPFKGRERKALNASFLSGINPDGKKEYRELIISWDFGFVFQEKIVAVSNNTTLSAMENDERYIIGPLVDTNRFQLGKKATSQQPLWRKYWYFVPIAVVATLIVIAVYWKKSQF